MYPAIIRWVAQWHSSGPPVYTGPASVHWLRVRAVAFQCTLGSRFQAHWFAIGLPLETHWLRVRDVTADSVAEFFRQHRHQDDVMTWKCFPHCRPWVSLLHISCVYGALVRHEDVLIWLHFLHYFYDDIPTVTGRILLKKASNAELCCFRCYQAENTAWIEMHMALLQWPKIL